MQKTREQKEHRRDMHQNQANWPSIQSYIKALEKIYHSTLVIKIQVLPMNKLYTIMQR